MIRRVLPLLLFAAAAAAQTFQDSNVLVTATNHGLFSVTSTLRLYNSGGVFQRDVATRSGPDGYGDTSVRQNVLWVTGGNAVYRLDPNGSVIGTSPGPSASRNVAPMAVGNMIVAGNTIGSTLYILDTTGSLLRTIDVGASATGIDLSADQCTLLYASGTEIRRYDICRNQSLSAFASLPTAGLIRTIRILADGSVLAMTLAGVIHVSVAGAILQTYPFGTFALALDVDGTSFWVGNGANLYKVDIATGNTLLGPIDAGNLIEAISLVGEPRAAVTPAAIAAIPTLSTTLLLVLIAALVALAVLRL